ncbi:MAG: 2-oxo acid dehydrogenase subunit E2, partial [Candidatus Poribacteria bacterium]|nr:2-oxo acid dehydrogenase subunit E2 [Candidatus Poribacteria bacterium]
MTTGTVGKWLVKEGDTVTEGDPVLEIETDKVVHELESPAGGSIAQILVEEGSKVPINAVLAILAAPGEQVEKREVASSAGEQAVAPSEAPVTPSPPAAAGAIKASPAARRLAKAHNVDLAQVKASGPGGRVVEADVQTHLDSMPTAPQIPDRIKASPLARRLAKEHGLDVATIAGSGPDGRVVRDDVLKAAEAAKVALAAPAPAIRLEVAAAEVIPMTGIRQVIAERMSHSSQTTASVTLNTEVDVTELIELRTWLNQKLSAKDVTLTYTDLLVKVVAHALREHPRLNATLSEDGIHLLDEISIGVAVALEDGLVVPVVRNVDQKGLSTISQEIRALAEKARSNQLSPDDLRGGTFTLTNLGIFGVDTFNPIINPPECAILGVGRIVKKPVVHDEEVAIRSMMSLSLSFDHRIVDGAPAAQFLRSVTACIEEPYLLLV